MPYYDNYDYAPRKSSEIYALRRNGMLEEARQLAEEYLADDKYDEDVLKAYAWTLIDIYKNEINANNLDDAYDAFVALSKIRFSSEDEFTDIIYKRIESFRSSIGDYTPRRSLKVYALRRDGKLDEARKLAEKYLALNRHDEELLKAYAWTLIDICKIEIQSNDIEAARKTVDCLSNISFLNEDQFTDLIYNRIRSFQLMLNPYYKLIKEANDLSKKGDNDKAFNIYKDLVAQGNLPKDAHESYGWVIYRYIRDHIDALDSVQVRSFLRDYIVLKNERPSLLHSQILNFALNYSKKDKQFNFIAFLRLWGPDKIRMDDYCASFGNDGKNIPSLMSRIAAVVIDYPYPSIKEFLDLIVNGKDDFLNLLREHFYWKIYRGSKESNATWDLFEQYLNFFPEASASEWHSKVLGLAERTMKEDESYHFYDFFRRWNPANLREADWKEEKGEDGQTYKPLALKALKKASDALNVLKGDQVGNVKWLLDVYDLAIKKYPDDDWNIRAKALIHIKAGQFDLAKDIYMDLCQKMGDKYYIWSEFAECCDDRDIKIALLCKAISLENNEDFIGKIRLKLARQLIDAGKLENARIELSLYKQHYTDMGWHINPDVETLLSKCSSAKTDISSNDTLYQDNISIAEEYAYSDIPYTDVVLVDQWKTEDGNERLTFVDGDSIEFAINKKKYPILAKNHKGQVWRVKLYKDTTERLVPVKNPPLGLNGIMKNKRVTDVKYIPLLFTQSEAEDWSTIPYKYGYVDHVNVEKKVYHIYSKEGVLLFEHFNKQSVDKKDYVKFRQYKKKVKDEIKTCICGVQRCSLEEAVQNFKSRIVAVDDINENKKLFHFVLGPGLIDGIIHYDQTDLRPSVGDCIKIYYFVKVIEDKKRPGSKKKIIEVLKSESTDIVDGNLIKEISGTLELKYKDDYFDEDYKPTPDFAFVGDYYVHKSILKKYNITSDCYVRAKIVYSGGGKWKVFQILY